MNHATTDPKTLPLREKHREAVRLFLMRHIEAGKWEFELPSGRGRETYFAHCAGRDFFIKLGVEPARYVGLDALRLGAPVVAGGLLTDGTSIIVQARIQGRTPTRPDYDDHMDAFAGAVARLHRSVQLLAVVPPAAGDDFRSAGLNALASLRDRWERVRVDAPQLAAFIDSSLDEFEQLAGGFDGAGLVVSHGDLRSTNWMLTDDGKLLICDLESMALDDPALDLGVMLWWNYPPALRPRFLELFGRVADATLSQRMRVRVAMHCLQNLLPRPGTFDRFDPDAFPAALADFRAALAGQENPRG